MTKYVCIAMLEDPPYNLIVAVTAYDPKDWCAELPLPSHLLCFERIKNADIMFNQFIHHLQADGINVKTDMAFRAQPHEVIRVFNQVRNEVFNSQQVTREVIDVDKNYSHAIRLVRTNTIDEPAAGNQIQSAANAQFTPTAKTPSTSLLLARQRLIATLKAKISELSPPLVRQQCIGKFTMQDGIAEDTETGLMWLRFAHGQTWQNGAVVADAEKVNWNKAFEIAKQLNLQGGYAGYSDWRLPTADELKSLIDKVKGKSGNFIDMDVFSKNAPWFWSSSSYVGSSFNACFVDFTNGYGNCVNKSSSGAVRLVRGNIIDEPVGNQIHSATKAR